MAGSKKTSMGKSVLKILFLPGISGSIAQMSFLKPSFMQITARIFERAGLIHRNHPAMYYGEPGVEKTSFTSMFYEAFSNVRAGSGNYYQIGLFTSFCIMMLISIYAMVASVFYISQFFVNVASAQLFTHPLGNTGIESINIQRETGAYNYNLYTGKGAHEDWGITILDKLFREGIQDKGGVIQNSFGSLMGILNNAVLVIAGIMILWMLVTVVIDTAKSGKIGGGRHNLVWAPIRIMMALGLIIPLGTKGFSTGQMIVLKFAEWGSNLGTNAWVKFVKTASASDMLAPTDVDNFNSLIDSYANIWMCQVSYNASLKQAGSGADANSVITYRKIEGATVTKNNGSNTVTYEFSNKRGVRCGSITFPTDILDFEGESITTYDKSIDEAVKKYLNRVGKVFITPFAVNLENPTFDQGSFNQSVIEFACSISGMALGEEALVGREGSSDAGATTGECKDVGWSNGSCNEDVNKGTLPDYSCYKSLLEDYGDSVVDGIESANAELTEAISNKSALVIEARTQGWPSIGWWYYKLYKMNFMVIEAGRNVVQISSTTGAGSGVIGEKVARVSEYYSKWWQKVTEEENLQTVSSREGGKVNLKLETGGNLGSITGKLLIGPISEAWDKYDSGVTAGKAIKALFNKDARSKLIIGAFKNMGTAIFNVTKGVGSFATAVFLSPLTAVFGGIITIVNSGEYPLTKLIMIGKAMMDGGAEILCLKTGMYVLGGLFSLGSAIPVVGGIFMAPYNFAAALVNGPIGELMQVVAMAVISASALPLYYIPMMPFIKVAFAVMTWMMSIFQAVVLLPVAALAHITTEGDGIVTMKQPWLVGLGLLFRPILTVIGFVGSILVLNTFSLYWSEGFAKIIVATSDMMAAGGVIGGAAKSVALITMYCMGIYVAANASFRLMETIPAAFFKYMGGSADVGAVSGDALAGAAAVGGQVGEMVGKAIPSPKRISRKKKAKGDKGPGLEKNQRDKGGSGAGGGEDGKNVPKSLGSRIRSAPGNALRAVKNAPGNAKQAVIDAKNDAKNRVLDTARTVKNAPGNALKAVKDAPGNAKQAVIDAKDKAKFGVLDTANKIKKAPGRAVDAVKDAASLVRNAPGNALGALKNSPRALMGAIKATPAALFMAVKATPAVFGAVLNGLEGKGWQEEQKQSSNNEDEKGKRSILGSMAAGALDGLEGKGWQEEQKQSSNNEDEKDKRSILGSMVAGALDGLEGKGWQEQKKDDEGSGSLGKKPSKAGRLFNSVLGGIEGQGWQNKYDDKD